MGTLWKIKPEMFVLMDNENYHHHSNESFNNEVLKSNWKYHLRDENNRVFFTIVFLLFAGVYEREWAYT